MNLKLIPLLLIVVALFQGCNGPQGPEGPQGPQGNALVGTTFDLVDVDFNAGNQYQFGLTFANAKVNVEESDAVLVYIDWEDVNGSPAYRLLPQTAFLTSGILTYNFDRTNTDFSVFLDGTAPRNTLPAEYTQNQRFRVIIVPADFAPARTSAPLDYKDYNAVVKAFNIDESKIRTISAK
jgi:hypothetical protein